MKAWKPPRKFRAWRLRFRWLKCSPMWSSHPRRHRQTSDNVWRHIVKPTRVFSPFTFLLPGFKVLGMDIRPPEIRVVPDAKAVAEEAAQRVMNAAEKAI